jgi:hypothetical protein
MEFASGIYKWLPKGEWDPNICRELKPVIRWLADQQIQIAAYGLWNIKSPDPVIFLDSPLPYDLLKKAFPPRNPDLMIEPDFVGCREHRLTVVFEGTPVKGCG